MGIVITTPVADPDRVALSGALAMQLTPCTKPGEYHNRHFHARTSSGVPMFVKLLDDVGYWRRAVHAAPLAESLVGRTPQLLDHGQLGSDRWWLVYEWRNLKEFTPTPVHIEQAGALLGQLHRATTGMHLDQEFRRHDLDEELAERTAMLETMDPGAADRIRAIRARWGSIEMDDDVCMTHGDVHWRNFAIDRDGEVRWYDWENAASGQRVLDFGKLVDVGLASPVDRDAFLHGYHQHAGAIYPWSPTMRLVRLWTTAGVLVYALARELHEFANHGYTVLGKLERL